MTAYLCQPEPLHLNLPEVQVKHGHNDLFLEQTEDMHFASLARTCTSKVVSRFCQRARCLVVPAHDMDTTYNWDSLACNVA